MKKPKTSPAGITAKEIELIEQLREHPEIMERVQSILEIARHAGGPLKTADEVEELLIEEVRRLGQSTMQQWAAHAEEQLSAEVRQNNPAVLSRKKKR